MADDLMRLSEYPEASDEQMTNDALMEVSVVDQETASGFESRKSPLSRLANYILNKYSSLNLGGSTRTVKAAIDAQAQDISSLSSSLSSLIVTADKVSQDVTLASGARLSVQIDCALDGYTLLGVIGVTTVSTEVFAINRFFLTATNTVTVTIYNTYSDSRTSKITVRCIYRKS